MTQNILENCGIKPLNAAAYFGFSWSSGCNNETLVSYNPTTGQPIAAIADCTVADYKKIIQGSLHAFDVWKKTPAPLRGQLIGEIGLLIRSKKRDLAALISLEMGKTFQEALGEVQEVIDMADFCVGQSRMLYGKTMHSERPQHRMYEQWHPLGIVGVVTAFNFPVAVWAWNALLSAVCGNVTIWKPSSKTPLSAIAIYKWCASVLQKNNLPNIFSLMITPDHPIAEAMLDDEHVPLISFTGSTEVGKKVATRVAARLGQSILELGGNNAIIVDESADLNLAIPAIVFSAVGTSGQRCTTARRLIVHEQCLEKVLNELKRAYQQLKVGEPLNDLSHVGPLVDSGAVSQFEQCIQEAVRLGGHIIVGGEILKGPGYFVRPTIITNVPHQSSLVFKETFAPILYVFSYKTFDEAIKIHNEVPQGLSSSLFTQKFQNSEQFLSCLGSDCGIANINIGTSGAEIGGAFGGEKATGRGRESGSDAWKVYMRRQTNTLNWGNELTLAQGIVFG